MEVIVFSSPGCKLYQNGKLIEEQPIVNNDFAYVAHKYIIENEGKILIKETFNSFILRLVINLISLLTACCTYRSSEFRDIQYKAYMKNKQLANFVFMPLFWLRGKAIIKPILCNDDSLIIIYLLKGKVPFMLEEFDAKIEIIANTRKKLNINEKMLYEKR